MLDKYFTDKEKAAIFDKLRDSIRAEAIKQKSEINQLTPQANDPDFEYQIGAIWKLHHLVNDSFLNGLERDLGIAATDEGVPFFFDKSGRFKDAKAFYKAVAEQTKESNQLRAKKNLGLKDSGLPEHPLMISYSKGLRKGLKEKTLLLDHLEIEINNKELKGKEKDHLIKTLFNQHCPQRVQPPFSSFEQMKEAVKDRMKTNDLVLLPRSSGSK